MQTTLSTDQTRPTQTDSALAAARASLAKLQEAAADTKAEADRWRITFEREPTAQAHAEMAVAEQRAVNAVAAAEQQQVAVQRLEEEQRRSARAEIERKLTAEAEATKKAIRDAGAEVVASIGAVQRALSLLGPLFDHERDARAAGVACGQTVLDDRLRDLRESLAPLGNVGLLAHSDGLTFTITTSLQAVPRSMR